MNVWNNIQSVDIKIITYKKKRKKNKVKGCLITYKDLELTH